MISEANLGSMERLKLFAEKGLEQGVECRVCNKKRQAVKPGVWCGMKDF
jgi:hypothetical protein